MDVLPKWERLFYWIAGIGTFFYAQLTFYRSCQDYKPYMSFAKGWNLLDGKRDALDYEWACFQFCLKTLVSLAAGHLVLSHMLVRLRVKESIFKTCLLVYDSLALSYVLGTKAALLFLCEVLIMFAACQQNFISVIWILFLIMTSSLNFEWVEKWQVFEDWHTTCDKQIFFISNAYLHIRLMSAAIEMINHKKSTYFGKSAHDKHNCETQPSLHSMVSGKDEKENTSYKETKEKSRFSLLDFMTYSMYFPIAVYGPIVTFDEFVPQRKKFYNSIGEIHTWHELAFSVCRIVFWLIFIEFAAHYMYPNSVSIDLHIVSRLSISGMIGFVTWQSLYFTMKYVCIFGISSLACKIDGISPPPLPRCTATMYRFTDIWKYFDAGNYHFIKKYIYVPLGGSRCGFYWQALASVTAFAFVYFWHGATHDIFLWAAGNWSVIAVEMIAIQLLKSKNGGYLRTLFSSASQLRIKALLYVPCFILSSIQIACFFFSKDIAYRMANTMVLNASWPAILVQTACFYFNFQNAMFITDRLASRKGKVD